MTQRRVGKTFSFSIIGFGTLWQVVCPKINFFEKAVDFRFSSEQSRFAEQEK
jgi:hypothetical protein